MKHMPPREEKTIYELFRISIIIKAFASIAEVIAGILLVAIPGSYVLRAVLLYTPEDTDSTTDRLIATNLEHISHFFATGLNVFIGLYIFIRGFAQLLIVLALLRNKRWAYPALLAVLAVIIATQAYDIYLSHSIAASIVTAFDIVTVWLTWHEYQIVLKARSA